MIPKKIKKIYINDVDENGSDMQNREYIDLSQVWHDASEEPQDKGKPILSYSEYFDYLFIEFPNYLMTKYGGQNNNWETVVLRNRISKWVYVRDLLPK